MPDLPSEFRRNQIIPALALALACIGAASMVYYHLGLFMPRVRHANEMKRLAGPYALGDDFYPIWLTARERPRDLYSTEVTREIQSGLFGRPLDPQIPTDPLTDYRTFAYPAFTDLLFWPTAEIPFRTLRIFLTCALALFTAGSVLLWMKALAWHLAPVWLLVILVLTLSSYPVLEGLYAGQLGLLVGFLLAASLVALARDQHLLAGSLMGLTLMKPQMTFLEMAFLILWSFSDWQHRKKFSLGLFSMVGILVVSALLVWPRWIQSWVLVLWAYRRYANPPLLKEVLASPFGPGKANTIGVILTAGALLLSLLLLWHHRSASVGSCEFWLTSSLLLSITAITLLPGQAVHDQVILLPGIFLIAKTWRSLAENRICWIILILGVSVCVWPWLAAMGLVVLRPIMSSQTFNSKLILALPLRTAAVFPFLVLALLVLRYHLGRKQTARSRSEAGVTLS